MSGEHTRVKIFYSYAHEDKSLRDELATHLGNRYISWHDRDIHAGMNWEHAIDTHLNSADIILLLISADFMASDYCNGVEMARALERQTNGEVDVIPIYLRPVHWENPPFNHLQLLPTNEKGEVEAVIEWKIKDKAFANIARGVGGAADEALKRRENSKIMHQYVAEAEHYISVGNYESALNAYSSALQLFPNNASLHKGIGDVRFEQERFSEALKAYDKAHNLGSKQAQLYIKRGKTLEQLRRVEDAITDYKHAAQLLDNDISSFTYLGTRLSELGYFKEAAEVFGKALKLAPGNVDLYIKRGDALCRYAAYQEALDAYSAALILAPKEASLYAKKGDVLAKLQRYQGALKAYDEAIRLDGGNVQLRKDKAEAQGEYEHFKTTQSSGLHISRRGLLILALILVVFLLIYPLTLLFHGGSSPNKNSAHATVVPTVNPKIPSGLGEFTATNGDIIGVNDGSYAPFDTRRDSQELSLKRQAAQTLHAGNQAGAESLWQQALSIDSSDAEAYIYQEDQRILESGSPYLTLVACVDFVSTGDPSTQRQLQGVYVAMREHNSGSASFKLRILIANSGNDVSDATAIAQQIVSIARNDKTVVGVIDWSTSSRSHQALDIFANAKLPQVSSQASDDALTGISPYYFRIVPPNNVQAVADASFVEKTLKAKNLVVFLDPKDNYGQNLASDFEDQLVRDGFPRPHEETFATDKNQDFSALIKDALNKYHPDAFFFAAASSADTELFQDALPTSGPFANLPVVSGDAGYVARPNSYNRWYFIAYAYPDEWKTIIKNNTPPFFQDYSAYFNANGQHHAGYYGATRSDDRVILTYDATQVLLTGMQIALRTHEEAQLSSQDLADALPQITRDQAFQGISGQISFDSGHDPINKAMVFVSISSGGYLQMKSWQGCFVKGCP